MTAKRALQAGQVRLNSYRSNPLQPSKILVKEDCLSSDRLFLLLGKEVRLIKVDDDIFGAASPERKS